MPDLTQLLARHGRILVLDAVSQQVQVGLQSAGSPALWTRHPDEAGRGLFLAIEELLPRAGIGLEDIGAFLFCEGPGSMLGTRTIAMALRTWIALKPRPVFRYQSLALAGIAEWRRAPRAITFIADARRESWHVQSLDASGQLAPLERRATAELPGGELLTPADFRVWSRPPAHVTGISYELPRLFDAAGDVLSFEPVDQPDVLATHAPDYRKWSAQPHSAETARPR